MTTRTVTDLFSIKTATQSDLEPLVEMGIKLQKYTEKSNPDMWRLTDDGCKNLKNHFSEMIADPRHCVLLAFNGEGNHVGMAIGKIITNADFIPEMRGSIEKIFVEEPYRRYGIGTALVARICEFFASLGIQDISLGYVVGNQQAERFWKGLGFRDRIRSMCISVEKLAKR
ncbi:MAG: GNAT family N-acetyltransferase [bacterium]